MTFQIEPSISLEFKFQDHIFSILDSNLVLNERTLSEYLAKVLLFLSLYFIFLLTWDHFSALFIILYVFLKLYKDWFKSMYVKISIK